MRLAITILVSTGLMIAPAVLATSASTPGFAATKTSEFSAATKKKKKKTEENLKAAPSAPPSKGQSSY
jgi:hypothetical protein